MSFFTKEDEELIEKFIGLSTANHQCPVVNIPTSATTSTDWGRCILAKVITDRVVQDGPFAAAMINVWGADPTTIIRPVARKCYVIELNNEEDLDKALMGGLWTYRGDVVATKQVFSQLELKLELVGYVDAWVQLYNIPFNCLNEEGIQVVARAIGTSVSAPVQGFVNGHHFVKVKIMLDLKEPLVVWALWRCHNDRTYAAKEVTFELFTKYFKAIE
ncbi:uncharacterized protein LOC144558551 [Carex rostrata]